LSDFHENLIFLTDFPKKAQISNLIKIRPLAAELFHAYGQTHMKLTVAFRYFANAPKEKERKKERKKERREQLTKKITKT
jgi:hypothetical protein